jgi:hypothetical protein
MIYVCFVWLIFEKKFLDNMGNERQSLFCS